MGARRTKNECMDEEWEFDTYEEMAAAAKKEARVCGDELRESADERSFKIYNSHQSSVRWKGSLTTQAKWVESHAWEYLKDARAIRCKNCGAGDNAVKRRFTVVLTNEELSILKDGVSEVQIRDVKYLVIEQILEQA